MHYVSIHANFHQITLLINKCAKKKKLKYHKDGIT